MHMEQKSRVKSALSYTQTHTLSFTHTKTQTHTCSSGQQEDEVRRVGVVEHEHALLSLVSGGRPVQPAPASQPAEQRVTIYTCDYAELRQDSSRRQEKKRVQHIQQKKIGFVRDKDCDDWLHKPQIQKAPHLKETFQNCHQLSHLLRRQTWHIIFYAIVLQLHVQFDGPQ